MKTVLVTGAQGFIGKNLRAALGALNGIRVLTFDVEDAPDTLGGRLLEADFVFHLAGVNRPISPEEFVTGNTGLTQDVVRILGEAGRKTPVLISSSTQAAADNPYGQSKRAAENAVFEYGKATGAAVYVYRLTNVFGRWCRPNYNSAVATFCHNIARDLDVTVSDPARVVELIYIDDVVRTMISEMNDAFAGGARGKGAQPLFVQPVHPVTLGDLVALIRRMRQGAFEPANEFSRALHATFLSYVPAPGAPSREVNLG